jgi:glycosidase
MRRLVSAIVAAVVILFAAGPMPLVAQEGGAPVMETNPEPPRTDQSVTLYFNAEEGTGGLENHDGDVYAHTGISTDRNADQAWKCVKNDWPGTDGFTGNRDDTQLTPVEGDPNRYRLQIEDIRAYYQATNTSCDLESGEKIETMNFVFRNADGSEEGKAEGGGDIFVDVVDVSGEEPVVETSITNPTGSPPLYPFMTATDTTVSVSVSADTANIDALSEVRLFVDGTQRASTSDDSLSYDLSMDTPNRYEIRAEVEATSGDSVIVDSTSTFFVRTPEVVDQARPSGVQDGINYNADGSVTLSLYAPNKEFVYAIGDFTDWEIDGDYFMKRHQAGPDSTHWWITLDNLSSGQEYAYQYFIDGDLRLGDPFSHKVLSPQDQFLDAQALGFTDLKPYPGEETENLVSVLEPGPDDFSFSEFTPPDRSELVIYELLVRDFLENNSYATLTDTLDYLDRMGVNAIELMPVSNFDGNISWGYSPNYHMAPDKAYGPPEDLKQFIEEAHSRGIAVFLDVVYNHATNRSPLVQMYGTSDANPWLNVPASSPFSVFNQLNHGSPFIKRYIDRANTYWLEEFNIDGFRFDLTKGFISGQPSNPNGYQPQRIDNLQRMADHIWDNVDSEAYIILEHFGVPQEERELASYRAEETGGMMLWNNMNHPYSQASKGVAEGSGLNNTYYENRGLSNPNYVTYMESHDEQWLMYRNLTEGNSNGEGYDIQTLETALNRQKLVGAFFYTVPGPRMIWQFGELGYGYGESGEQCLVGTGDDCPTAAPGRTGPKPIRWDYRDPAQSPDRVRLYEAWSALINLRTQYDVFSDPDTEVSFRVGADDRGRRIELQHPSMNAVIIGNFGVTERSVAADFPSSGSWYDFFTGEELQIESDEQEAPIPLAPGEFHIYTDAPVETPEPGLVPYGVGAPPPEPPTELEATSDTDAGTIQLSWTASSSSDVTGYRVYRGTEASFDTTGAHLATVDSGVTSYTDSVQTDQVYYYRVGARDNDGARSTLSDPVSGLLYPETLSIGVSQSFGDRSSSSGYRLVALPGEIRRGVESTFAGRAGEDWQVYRDNGASSDFLEAYDESSAFQFRPGRGFWAISDSSWSVEDDVETVPLRSTISGLAAVVSLREGWNIISNPLEKDVDWSQVEAANGGDLQPLWQFDGSFQQATTFSSARSGEAFYFHNRGGRSQLRIPYVSASTSAASKASSSEAAPGSTALLTLAAEGPDGTVSQVQVGRAANADDGVGAEDVLAPPSRFEQVSLRVHASGTSSREGELMRSVQSVSGDGSTFDLRLRSPEGEPIELHLKTERVSAQYEAVRLVNRQTGASYNLRGQRRVDLTPKEDETELTLLAGTDAFVQKKQSELVPDELRLWPNFPNPFREQTTVEYTLPDAGPVTVEVFDILGRRVGTLVDRRQEEGLHRIDWAPTRSSGGISSGMYILRLTANGTSRTQKMTVIR